MSAIDAGPGSPLIAAAVAEPLPSMWRIELLHPATVHFSIALTIVGALFWAAGAFRGRWPRMGAFDLVGSVTLILAAVSAWVAVQTGFWADAVVGRELFDPRPLKDHENAGLTLAWLITGTTVVDILRRSRYMPVKLRRPAWLVVAVALLASIGLVAYTAHLGAGLVYQQGAGVQHPSQE